MNVFSWIRSLLAYREPTSQDVKDFWAFMTQKYGTKVIDKNSFAEMQAVTQLLDLIGILDKETFLKKYTTTVGKKIYAPFQIGVADENWSLWAQLFVCAHEHQHIIQNNRDNLAYDWDYITSHAKRAHYEVEAYRVNMELGYRYRKIDPVAQARKYADHLWQYGCTKVDVDVAFKALSLAAVSIKQGALTTEASRVAAAWLDVRLRS